MKADGTKGWKLGITGDGRIHFEVATAGGSKTAMHNSDITDGEWHTVVAQYDGAAIRVQVDGASGAAVSASVLPCPDTALVVGQDGGVFSGAMRELEITGEAWPGLPSSTPSPNSSPTPASVPCPHPYGCTLSQAVPSPVQAQSV